MSVLSLVSLIALAFPVMSNKSVLQEWNLHGVGSSYEVLYYKEGIECTLAVLRNKKADELELNINGQSTAYAQYRDIQVHQMLIHIPMLMHENPEEVLVIGFGMGCTGYGATLHKSANVTCVELVKDEIETAPYFQTLNYNVLAHPRFNFVHDDGRNQIRLIDKKYDVISFNAIHPRLSPALYTRDFYELCRKRMTPESIICAWLPTNWLTTEEFRSLVGTFTDVFPQSTFWYCNSDHILLIGELKKPEIDFDDFKARTGQSEISEHLASTNIADPLTILGTLTLGPNGLKSYVEGAPLVTDDRPRVEFSKCMDYGLNDAVWWPIMTARQSHFEELMEIVKASNVDDRLAVRKNLLSLEPFVIAHILSDPKYRQYGEALKKYDEALRFAPQNRNISIWRQEAEVNLPAATVRPRS